MSAALSHFELGRASEPRLALGLGVALSLHALVFLGLRGLPVRLERPVLIVTEVDIAPVAAVAPEPPPPAPAPEPPVAEPVRRVAQRPAPRAPAPPAAAAPLHTASEDAPTTGEPVRFAVDARGTNYGFGVVAQGGVASAAPGGHAASAAAAPVAPARDLRAFATPPRLDESDPCRGHFPQAASADRGEVTLELTVSAEGAVREARVLRELPAQQGFGRAALGCLRTKRFLPARDASGREVASLAPVSVRFAR